MNNKILENSSRFNVLIPPSPFSCKQKKGEEPSWPLFAKQRGVGVST